MTPTIAITTTFGVFSFSCKKGFWQKEFLYEIPQGYCHGNIDQNVLKNMHFFKIIEHRKKIIEKRI